jgi:hypothetical protein
MTFLSRKLAGRAETDLGLWSKPDWKRNVVHAFYPVIDTKIGALLCCADLEHKDDERDYPRLFDFVVPVHRYV